MKVFHLKFVPLLCFFVALYSFSGILYCGCHETIQEAVAETPPCHEDTSSSESPQVPGDDGCCCIKSPYQKAETIIAQQGPLNSWGDGGLFFSVPLWFSSGLQSESKRILKTHPPLSPHASAKALAIKQSFLI